MIRICNDIESREQQPLKLVSCVTTLNQTESTEYVIKESENYTSRFTFGIRKERATSREEAVCVRPVKCRVLCRCLVKRFVLYID